MKYKICNKCREKLPVIAEYFHRDKYRKDGFKNTCKICIWTKYYGKAWKPKIKPETKKGYKICTKCDRELPATLDYFYKQETGKYGLRGDCKECRKKYRDYYYIEHKEQVINQHKIYYKENQTLILERNKTYRIKHKREILQQKKEYGKTEKVKKRNKIKDAKRKRNLGWFTILENSFPDEVEVDYHHINNLLVVPIPNMIHRKCHHFDIDEHRERCNVWMYYLYGIDFNLLLGYGEKE